MPSALYFSIYNDIPFSRLKLNCIFNMCKTWAMRVRLEYKILLFLENSLTMKAKTNYTFFLDLDLCVFRVILLYQNLSYYCLQRNYGWFWKMKIKNGKLDGKIHIRFFFYYSSKSTWRQPGLKICFVASFRNYKRQ